MPIENKSDTLPPRKYYLDGEIQEEVALFVVEESLAQFLRDLTSKDFTAVYQGFDFPALCDFAAWLNMGFESDYLIKLKEIYESETLPNNTKESVD